MNINVKFLFPNMEYSNKQYILQSANDYITINGLWKSIKSLKFNEPNIELCQDVDIDPTDPWVIELINKLRFNMTFCKNDTELLHTILYLKYAQKNNYMIDELPLLVKISDCNYNPIIYEMDA